MRKKVFAISLLFSFMAMLGHSVIPHHHDVTSLESFESHLVQEYPLKGHSILRKGRISDQQHKTDLHRHLYEIKDPGQIDTDGKSYLKVSTSDGWIDILELQLSGKKRMKIEDFLRGFALSKAWNVR
jgi:hypothetical protein